MLEQLGQGISDLHFHAIHYHAMVGQAACTLQLWRKTTLLHWLLVNGSKCIDKFIVNSVVHNSHIKDYRAVESKSINLECYIVPIQPDNYCCSKQICNLSNMQGHRIPLIYHWRPRKNDLISSEFQVVPYLYEIILCRTISLTRHWVLASVAINTPADRKRHTHCFTLLIISIIINKSWIISRC